MTILLHLRDFDFAPALEFIIAIEDIIVHSSELEVSLLSEFFLSL